jgi:hypothetical protein
MTNLNSKIKLECNVLDLVGGADPNIGYMTIENSQFKLAHNYTTVNADFDLGIISVRCNDLSVINNGIIKELGVTNNATILKIKCTELAVTNNAILPKINSRP